MKQSKEDRLKRLTKGQCPIHGLTMYQTGNEEIILPCGHVESGRYIASCTRKDCKISAYFEEPFGEGELLAEFLFLIEGK